jgi:hypothetical protein
MRQYISNSCFINMVAPVFLKALIRVIVRPALLYWLEQRHGFGETPTAAGK